MERKQRTIGGISDLSRSRAQAPRTADLIYRELHRDIVWMKRQPNSKISEKELLEHFGVSRTPLREAILRLSEEGLVSVFPQAGTFVAPIPVRLLMESILIRKALETVIAETATRLAAPADLQAIDANLAAMEEVLRSGDLGEFHSIDSEFHRLIGRISGLSTVMATIEHVRAQIDRYRLMTLPQAGRLTRVVAEHRAVRDAIALGDPSAAGTAMAQHIGQMLDEVEALRGLDRAFFYDDRNTDHSLGGKP